MTVFFVFLIGTAIGSFLNVLIDRLPHDESVIKGRSYCDSCKKQLAWYDLIPILSFVLLRGRCRYCHSPIGWYYPLVEFTTGLLFLFTFLHLPIQNFQFSIFSPRGEAGNFQFIATLFYYFFIVSSLIVIFFTDIKYGIIPDKIVYPGIFLSLMYLILHTSYFIPHVLSALGAFLLFFLLHAVTRGRGMGFGDVKLAGFLGLFLGFPKVVVALYVAFLTGAVVALILVLLRKKKFKGSTVPFGPFLVIGTLISLFYGEMLMHSILAFLSA